MTENNEQPPQEEEKMLYRPQLLKYKYKTCLEKPRITTDAYDPDTMNSLKALMKTTSFGSVKKPLENEKTYLRTEVTPSPSLAQSQENLLPQWLKYDKNVLRFHGYLNEHVTESAYENYRIRPCTILFYLEDDSVHVIEPRKENSGFVQGDFIKRKRVKFFDKNNPDDENQRDLTWKDFNLGQNIYIYGKNFRLCKCDDFTRDFYKKQGVKLNPPEEIPEIDFSSKYAMVDFEKVHKNIADLKEYTEVGLGGGHPNGGLEQFLENDRKVLSFDLTWYDPYDKEDKKYKLNYYLADGQIEICEIRVNNSGKYPFPKLLRKSKLPKIPRMVYCPGLLVPEEDYYTPKDLVIGGHIYVYNRKCQIVGCDDFTSKWYKDNLGIEMESIKSKNKTRPPRVIHPIPPYNGYGTEEDSMLNVKYLNFQHKGRENYIDKFKRDKHILRFLCRMISSVASDSERTFLLSFYCRDDAIQIYEIAGKNSGRQSCKFFEKQRVKNPYTGNYYVEKDFVIGNLIYVNKYIFKLLESDEYTRKYMVSNPEVFKDADIGNVVNRIRSGANTDDFDDFLVHLLYTVDPKGTNFASKEDIDNGLKAFRINLSEQEISTLLSRLNREGNLYSMEDLYNYIVSN